MRTLTCLLLAVLLFPAGGSATAIGSPGQERGRSVLFRYSTDGFWLNLHHFLYVLGRAEAKLPDRTRRAVAGAPDEAEAGLRGTDPEDVRAWRGAVTVYAGRLSRLDAVFDEPLVSITRALARLGGGSLDTAANLPADVRRALNDAAPVYRRLFWPAHERANLAWVERTQPQVDRHGDNVLATVTRAYALPWPAGGYPVQVSAYANWAGAYSTQGRLLVVSSLDPGLEGTLALEIVVHEAMHQWDEDVDRALAAAARDAGLTVAGDLSHALIFYTAGEAVRRAVPGHVPYAEVSGIWSRRLGRFKAAIDAAWLPWLDGRVTREAALADLVRRAAGGGAANP